MIFEEFKEKFQYVFSGEYINYDVHGYVEEEHNPYGIISRIYLVDIAVTSSTPPGTLRAEITLSAENAKEFITKLEEEITR